MCTKEERKSGMVTAMSEHVIYYFYLQTLGRALTKVGEQGGGTHVFFCLESSI